MDINFFAEIVRTGTFLGADAGMSQQEVQRYLGDDPWETPTSWDYGLVEFFWGSRFEVNLGRTTELVPFSALAALVSLVPQSDGTYLHAASDVVVHVQDGLVSNIVSRSVGVGGLDIPGDRVPVVNAHPDFFADIVETGTVLGVDADLDPSVVRRVFGDFGYDNDNSESFWWGYDLVEIFWHRRKIDGVRGSHFSVQTHRLNARNRPLLFADLEAELTRRGIPLTPLPTRPLFEEYQEYWQPSSRMALTVHVPCGEVEWIGSDFHQDHSQPDWGDYRAIYRSMKEVVNFSPAARLKWIAKHRHDSCPWGWWMRRIRTITNRATSSDEVRDREKWVDFGYWALAQCPSLDVPPALAAQTLAEFTATLEDTQPDMPRPSADTVVRACLAYVTGMDRTSKSLLAAARLHRHALRDLDLLASLDSWIARWTDIPSVSMPRL
ncbi:hypothetical protein LWC34_37300 [Kibdelosporangium philippinense]|uniref:Uncharacterized protein n=1 Tax=Kibdelosporangium philippinense TaxID=211113 RepID=A0ABS8ZKV8_9PSEU|nr:hypothetical protein [Kibdelosporangium philippinense]MCE7008431.1 hypothetical protein [Kibdelosporangium philippinense]